MQFKFNPSEARALLARDPTRSEAWSPWAYARCHQQANQPRERGEETAICQPRGACDPTHRDENAEGAIGQPENSPTEQERDFSLEDSRNDSPYSCRVCHV